MECIEHGTARHAGSRTHLRLVVGGLLCLLSLPVARAEDGPINAERPGFSSSPLTLSPSTLQIEAGYQYTADALDVQSFPNALLRIGLVDRWELQIGWPGRIEVDTGQQTIRGAADLSVGVKHTVTAPGAATSAALFAGVTLPTGNRAFSSGDPDPTLGVFWTHSAELDWFGTATVSESGGDLTWSNAVGLSLPAGPTASGYVEYVGQFPEGSGPLHSANAGLTMTPRNDLQLDVFVGAALNDRAADWFAGAGAAYRF